MYKDFLKSGRVVLRGNGRQAMLKKGELQINVHMDDEPVLKFIKINKTNFETALRIAKNYLEGDNGE